MLRLPWGWDMGTYGPPEFDAQFAAATLPKPEDLHNKAVEEICRKYLNLRYQLLPYLYSAVAETHATGLPLMRALWLEYPQDARAAAVEDSYMWGGSMIVSPVLEAGATHRTTYLPRGEWWDYWSHDRLTGGTEVTREVTLETMPLYVKAGAVVPIGPVKQYAEEASSEPLLLRIYPGADGTATLYEDDGTSFNYQRGTFTRIACSWDDSSRTLSLKADKTGNLPEARTFVVEVAGSEKRKRLSMSGEHASAVL
jgi:alpha-glucosidase/alpha-D-xyloside xylohydrolase